MERAEHFSLTVGSVLICSLGGKRSVQTTGGQIFALEKNRLSCINFSNKIPCNKKKKAIQISEYYNVMA